MKKRISTNTCVRVDRDGEQILRCKEQIGRIDQSLSLMAQVLALTGNPVRLKIVYLLQSETKLCVCDLSEILEMKIPAVSQHLRKLKDAGLVFSERNGTVIYYQISSQLKSTLDTILHLIEEPVLV